MHLAPGGGAWSYADLQRAANRIAHVLVERSCARAGKSRPAARAEHADAGGVLVRRAQSRRHRRDDDAALSRARAALHDGEGAGQARALRRALARRARARVQRLGGRCTSPTSTATRRRRIAREPHAVEARRFSKTSRPRRKTSRSSRSRRERPATPKAAMHYHRDLLAICDTYGARVLQPRARRSLLRKPAARVHVWSRRPAALSALRRRRDAAARKGRSDRAACGDRKAFGVTTLFTAPIAYRAMAGVARRLRHLDAAHVRFGRRDAAQGGLGGVAREDRT